MSVQIAHRIEYLYIGKKLSRCPIGRVEKVMHVSHQNKNHYVLTERKSTVVPRGNVRSWGRGRPRIRWA